MKKTPYTSLILAVLALTSCVDFNDATREISAHVQLQLPDDFTSAGDLSGHTVVLNLGGQQYQALTDANGEATFTGLVPDVYDISCSWEISPAEYHALTGQELVGATGCTISGSLNSHLIREEQTICLSTLMAVNRDILIGKIYHSGSKYNNSNKSYQAGKYLELYNNGSAVCNVAGLYIGLAESGSTQAYPLQNLHNDYADSVVVMKQVFRIPADRECLVQPGGTVLLVNSAVDHREDRDMENDLSQADFEAKDVTGRTQNNPATPALELTFTTSAQLSVMNLVQGGPCAVCIFNTEADVSQWPRTYAAGKTSGTQYLLVPKRYVIDGVEILHNTTSGVNVATKRLYDDIDAGYTYSNAISGSSGEVVCRKTSRVTDDGRIVLMDTNNSSNDFNVSTTIKPRLYDE